MVSLENVLKFAIKDASVSKEPLEMTTATAFHMSSVHLKNVMRTNITWLVDKASDVNLNAIHLIWLMENVQLKSVTTAATATKVSLETKTENVSDIVP